MNMLKTIYSVISGFPMLTKIFESVMSKGKIDHTTVEALEKVSPDFKNVVDSVSGVGSVSQVADILDNASPVHFNGKTIDPKTLSKDIRSLKAPGSEFVANLLDGVMNLARSGNRDELEEIARQAGDIKSWIGSFAK